MLYAQALRRIIVQARTPDALVVVGLLEGAAWGIRGKVNVYRLRLVNDTADSCNVLLTVHGEAPASRPFEVHADRALLGYSAADVYLVTDWVGQFDLDCAPPATDDGLRFLDATRVGSRCCVKAQLSAGGHLLHELRIVQQLAE